jgi:F-type H+-transporting ATPase subunit gamma
MSGTLKEVRTRIKSVQSTQQITKAMKMVSAAKLRRAQDAIIAMRPFAKKVHELMNNVVGNTDLDGVRILTTERPVHKALIILITSDRGLCGGYNANLIKLVKSTIAEKYADINKKGDVTVWNIGKKGYESLTKQGYKTVETYKELLHNPTYENVKVCAEAAAKGFWEKQWDVIEIVYSQFKNAATQRMQVERFLPIPVEETQKSKVKIDYIFEPGKVELMQQMLPRMLNVQLYKAVLDANASEHGARMTAMDKASENADELLRGLKITYNRARQAAITTELTEIVSGAAALKGA